MSYIALTSKHEWAALFFLRAQGERRSFRTKRAQGERERKTRSFLRSLLGHSVDLEMQYFAAFCISKLPTMLPIIWISFKIHVKEYSSFAASLKCNYMLVIFPTTRYMRKLLKNEERRSFDAERKRVLFFSHASASSSAHVRFFGKERERVREIEERVNALIQSRGCSFSVHTYKRTNIHGFALIDI